VVDNFFIGRDMGVVVAVWGWKEGCGGGKRWGDGCGMMGLR